MKTIPAMHAVLADKRIAAYEAALGRDVVKRAADEVFGRARASRDGAPETIVAELALRLESIQRAMLLRVINATGIIIHTNLGRAPLAGEALAAVAELSRGYSNLEFDLETGERGSRYERVAGVLNDVTGAEDSLVVNNCAAAVLLVLDTFAKGREVIVARSQLVEIGGGFRIPEVLERSGATLVEVGTTNRVYLEDFERALSPRTALLLTTHPSNYRIDGFTHEASPRDLAELGRRAGVPVVEDLGSGALVDLAAYGAPHERTVQEALADGIGLVTFSGDKLLGGPQAGIVVGRSHLVARLRGNPLLRALRVDKMTLAALDATLQIYRGGAPAERLPIFRMIGATLDELRARAQDYLAAMPGAKILESDAYVGGGTLAQERIPSIAVALPAEDAAPISARLRRNEPPIVARIADGSVLLDLRTIAPAEDAVVIDACRNCLT
ncbi:MAG TPA: L-seryl-tRNA(Sec) selenium transferase [Candidatus Cybelea sp.]